LAGGLPKGLRPSWLRPIWQECCCGREDPKAVLTHELLQQRVHWLEIGANTVLPIEGVHTLHGCALVGDARGGLLDLGCLVDLGEVLGVFLVRGGVLGGLDDDKVGLLEGCALALPDLLERVVAEGEAHGFGHGRLEVAGETGLVVEVGFFFLFLELRADLRARDGQVAFGLEALLLKGEVALVLLELTLGDEVLLQLRRGLALLGDRVEQLQLWLRLPHASHHHLVRLLLFSRVRHQLLRRHFLRHLSLLFVFF